MELLNPSRQCNGAGKGNAVLGDRGVVWARVVWASVVFKETQQVVCVKNDVPFYVLQVQLRVRFDRNRNWLERDWKGKCDQKA